MVNNLPFIAVVATEILCFNTETFYCSIQLVLHMNLESHLVRSSWATTTLKMPTTEKLLFRYRIFPLWTMRVIAVTQQHETELFKFHYLLIHCTKLLFFVRVVALFKYKNPLKLSLNIYSNNTLYIHFTKLAY